jgi:hypothetical protein
MGTKVVLWINQKAYDCGCYGPRGLMVWMEFFAMIVFLGVAWNPEKLQQPIELDGSSAARASLNYVQDRAIVNIALSIAGRTMASGDCRGSDENRR